MKGIGVSPGIAIGKARLLLKKEAVHTGILLNDETEMLAEIEKYDQAVQLSISEIEAIKTGVEPGSGEEELEILEVHIELLNDPQLKTALVHKIKEDRKNANDAIIEVIGEFVQLFKNMKDEYMSARSADIQDIGNRILQHLQGTEAPFPENSSLGNIADTGFPGEAIIIIAEDIAPSDLLGMHISPITGFATRIGGKNSHAAIIARSRGIPAVVGCGEGLLEVRNNDILIIDGLQGIVVVNPDPQEMKEYRLKKEMDESQTSELKSLRDVPAITSDGASIKLLANISGVGDMDAVSDHGGEGVGLFRSELLFMSRDSFPTEDEQFEFYKQVALRSGNKPVTIRTLDIGGDKQLSYFEWPVEQNPFLGYRAIRISLDRKDLFRIQLKAILRAGCFGNIRIMFPMIGNVQEIREAKEVLEVAKAELDRSKIAFDHQIRIGIMIEIPSAAITSDILAKEVDFFSIGTNDLCQYTLAVDRMNEKIASLYDPFNPGLLRLIQYTIEQGHKNNISVGLCGELAADPMATLLLLGMGLEEFSMNAPSIPFIKQLILNHSLSAAKEVCRKVMEMDNSQDIISYLKETNL
ncbi:phosphoenolpyruvate--protein phosphotransferase [Flavitalea flava]